MVFPQLGVDFLHRRPNRSSDAVAGLCERCFEFIFRQFLPLRVFPQEGYYLFHGGFELIYVFGGCSPIEDFLNEDIVVAVVEQDLVDRQGKVSLQCRLDGV